MENKETRSLIVVLTRDEVADCAMELARNIAKTNEQEDQKKSVMSAFKDRLDRLSLDTRVLARKVETGRDYREVECFWTFDIERAKATLFRSDTAESVEERKMTDDEMQAALPFKEAPDATH